MIKLLSLLLLSFLSTQGLTAIKELYSCEWYELVNIHQENSKIGKGVNTNYIDVWGKKFLLGREEDSVRIMGQEPPGRYSFYMPINLNRTFEPGNVQFAGASSSYTTTKSFMYSNGNFFFSVAFDDSNIGDFTAGIAKCTHY